MCPASAVGSTPVLPPSPPHLPCHLCFDAWLCVLFSLEVTGVHFWFWKQYQAPKGACPHPSGLRHHIPTSIHLDSSHEPQG